MTFHFDWSPTQYLLAAFPMPIFFKWLSPIVSPGKFTIALTSSDFPKNQLSKSDYEAMNFSLSCFGKIGKQYGGEFVLSNISYAYPEWNKYSSLFVAWKTKREDMYYEDFLTNVNDKHPMIRTYGFSDPFKKLSQEEQSDLLEEMQKYSSNL